MKRAAALAVALLVHALTFAFIVLGAWTIVAGAEYVLGVLAGGLLIGIGWVLRPRLPRLPADAEVLGRAEAAELYGAAERVASALGVRPPELTRSGIRRPRPRTGSSGSGAGRCWWWGCRCGWR